MHNLYALLIIRVCKTSLLSIQITCPLVMWFLMQLRSCDFVGAIHDRVTNDAGGGGGCRTRALQLSRKHPRLIVESLPTSTSCLTGWILNLPGIFFFDQIIPSNVPGLKKVLVYRCFV